MAKFVYKFETILNLKVQMEDSLKNELGKAYKKLEHEKNKLLALENKRKDLISDFNQKSSTGVSAGKLREYGSYIALVKDRIVYQKDNVNYSQSVVDKCKGRLIKAVQEKEMFEKLKDKQYKGYVKEQFKKDQKLVDEIVSYKQNKLLAGDKNG